MSNVPNPVIKELAKKIRELPDESIVAIYNDCLSWRRLQSASVERLGIEAQAAVEAEAEDDEFQEEEEEENPENKKSKRKAKK